MAPQTTIEKMKLSGSTDGMPIKVVATATVGTTIHTAVAGTGNSFDEVWLWADNTDSTARLLTIEFGDATAPDHNVPVTLPPKSGPQLVIPGWILQNAKVITAFAAAANVVVIDGYVNRLA